MLGPFKTMSSSPPPLPVQRPIRRAEFVEKIAFRLGHVSLDYDLIRKSNARAETWINANPGIEIVQIETFHSSVLAVTVVWYR